jgi:purine nucleoside phosphorylase
MSTTIGIIGGSGLYDMAELTDREERRIETPFGPPSAPYVLGTLRGKRVAFLARHGAGHRLLPTELNFRANIYGFKLLGVEYILSASAVGVSEQQAADLVIPISSSIERRTRIDPSATPVAHGLRPSVLRPLSDVALRRPAHRARRSTGARVCMEGRSSRRWPNRGCTDPGAWTSSA